MAWQRAAPGGWNRPNAIPTTIFPQSIGLGATWDVDLMSRIGAIEGYEARYVMQSPNFARGGLVIRALTPISVAIFAGAGTKNATAKTHFSTALCPWPS